MANADHPDHSDSSDHAGGLDHPGGSAPPVIVVGAGLAGLCCALHLTRAGVPVEVHEASDRPGGRVATDTVDGFRLDRGFHVWLEAYPEGRDLLDAPALAPGAFGSGALIFDGQALRLFADPLRHPRHALRSLAHPVGTLMDKVRLGLLRAYLARRSEDQLLALADRPTRETWRGMDLSDRIVDGFLAPFFRGIFLDPDLATSARLFAFVYAMFGRGRALLPAGGMQAIPEQLAAGLAPGALHLNSRVGSVEAGGVVLAGGERRAARAVVVAVDDPAAFGLPADPGIVGWYPTTCVYFACDRPPYDGPWLALNGSGQGRVNQVAVTSNVARGLAPPGQHLVAASLNELPDEDDAALAEVVRGELRGWFGRAGGAEADEVDGWRLLAVSRIARALPRFAPGHLPGAGWRETGGVVICGDHTRHPSQQGAMASGRAAATRVLAALGAAASR
jgi:phytoene dehydrogenase-like protein